MSIIKNIYGMKKKIDLQKFKKSVHLCMDKMK